MDWCSIIGIVVAFPFDLYPPDDATIFCQLLSTEVQQLHLSQILPQLNQIFMNGLNVPF